MKRACTSFIIIMALLTIAIFPVKVAYADTENEIPLKLLATVIDKDYNQSSCIIMNLEANKLVNCKSLDKIAGYQVVKITRGSVKLLKDGRIHILDFPLGNENAEGCRESITIKRQAVLEKIFHPGLLLTETKPMPYVQAGKIIGFKIPALKDTSLLKMSGLAEGDIATKVNGENLDSISKALQLYNKYKDQKQINLEIKRGDVVMNLNYLIN